MVEAQQSVLTPEIMVKYIDDQNLNRGFNYLFRYISGGNDLNKNFNYNALLVEDHGNASVALENLLEKGELPSVTNMDWAPG